jgi:hypothetical protein
LSAVCTEKFAIAPPCGHRALGGAITAAIVDRLWTVSDDQVQTDLILSRPRLLLRFAG